MLFQVSGTEVYICGSLHLLPEGQEIPPSLFDAISKAEFCVFESNLDNTGEPSYVRYPHGDSLDRHISPDLFAATSKLCGDLKLHAPHSYKPWWLSIVLAVHLLIRAGNNPNNGVDRQLWNTTKQLGKRPFFLESIDVLKIFDSSPVLEQIDRLKLVVANPNLL